VSAAVSAYFDQDRLRALSLVMNGLLFLVLMLLTEKSESLDLRRASKILEILALVHILTALFANAMDHRDDPLVKIDASLYVGAAILFLVLAPFRSRWRMLVGGLAGCGFGSYLLVDLKLVERQALHHRPGPDRLVGGLGHVCFYAATAGPLILDFPAAY